MVKTHVFGHYTTNLYADDASIGPSENILKYKSFEEIIKQHQEWRLDRVANTSEAPRKMEMPTMDRGSIESFESLLHPEIRKHALSQFTNGHLREAVLNSIMAVFDLIRDRTKLNEDGDRLIGKAFSLDGPYLILSEIQTESGQNDQKGFMQIFKGAYQGIRNPKAHSLNHDLTEEKAAQYLVLASLLARRVEEATLIKEQTQEEVA
ncbi:MAG: TIGR02391 family protein [Alphaproteobacteria bacterium CG_4_9_14_3_um_filter_47_13]|nr:MAG: TIGR02391 family protein [Alphaproteobacteria bacterium CG_4_9_14_3_um_filter_47_13]